MHCGWVLCICVGGLGLGVFGLAFFFVGGFGCCFLGHHIAYATHELKEEVPYVTGLP